MLAFPLKYIYITQTFKKNMHNGVDMRGQNRGEEVPIYSPEDGTVIGLRNNYKTQDLSGNSYGNYIKIQHSNGITTLMAHLKYNSINVKLGDKVKFGQQIAIMGTTGHSTGIHLHYEVFINNVKQDPLLYTYIYPNQEVDNSSKKYIKYSTNVNPSPKDEKVDQIKINVSNLSIRKEPSETSERLGFLEKDKYYNFYEEKKEGNYDWYNIGQNLWVANQGEYITVYRKLEENKVEQTETNYKFKYTVEETNTYIIKLNKGETLYIKWLKIVNKFFVDNFLHKLKYEYRLWKIKRNKN